MLDFLQKIIIVTGHYGSGKTNLSINLALDLKKRGDAVTLVDMDIVNPYFRTADFKKLAAENGIKLVASPFANSNVELPALAFGLDGYWDGDETLILDVGGDDAGAIALGQHAHRITPHPYTMICVVNRFRNLTKEPKEAADMLEDIETASRLSVTHVVNNSNMGPETTKADVVESVAWAKEAAALAGKEFAFTAVKRELAAQMDDQALLYPVDIHVKTSWQ